MQAKHDDTRVILIRFFLGLLEEALESFPWLQTRCHSRTRSLAARGPRVSPV